MLIAFCSFLIIIPICVVSNDDLEYDITPERNFEVIAIDSSESRIAIATNHSIFLYELPSKDGQPSVLIGQAERLNNVSSKDAFLEFKLTSSNLLVFCEATSCWTCKFAQMNNKCEMLNISVSKISSASVTSNNGKLAFWLMDNRQRSTLTIFATESNGQLENINYHELDDELPSAPKKQVAGTSFSRGDFSYLISSFEQLRYSSELSYSEEMTIIQITRVNISDKSIHKDSRLDLVLECRQDIGEYSATITGIGPAHYDLKKEQLFVILQQVDPDGEDVCRFDMRNIDLRFDRDSKKCQGVNLHPNEKSNISMVDKRCPLNSVNSTYYSYEWLMENKVFMGKHVARLPESNTWHTALLPDNNGNLFIVGNAENRTLIYWVPTDSRTTYSTILTENIKFPTPKHNIAITGSTLFAVNGTSVAAVPISCNGFYKSCEDIVKDGHKSPARCVWCPDIVSERAISLDAKHNCRHPLTTTCPPIMKNVEIAENLSEVNIFGAHLNSLQNPRILVCQKPCTIVAALSNDNLLRCALSNSSEQSDSCEVTMTGKLEEYNDYAIYYVTAKPRTNTILIIIIVVAVIALLILIGLFARWYCSKKAAKEDYIRKRKGLPTLAMVNRGPGTTPSNYRDHRMSTLTPATVDEIEELKMVPLEKQTPPPIEETPVTPMEPIKCTAVNPGYITDGKANPFEFEVSQNPTSYRRLFNEMDNEIKIYVTQLRWETQIGKGLTVGKFDHPNVIKLIGIAFTDTKIPIIVTEYMQQGDLHSFLNRKHSLPVTLRTLLTFAIEIAEGMDYLHSKKFIHRDLAARNCMLDDKMHVKIADFGLARECNEDMMYKPSKKRELPFPWMPLEALENQEFSLKGDVWAYGIVLWELMTLGRMRPYHPLVLENVIDYLRNGRRLKIPPYCPVQLYTDVMIPCWVEDASDRPQFKVIVYLVKNIREKLNRQDTEMDSPYMKVTSNSSGISEADKLKMMTDRPSIEN